MNYESMKICLEFLMPPIGLCVTLEPVQTLFKNVNFDQGANNEIWSPSDIPYPQGYPLVRQGVSKKIKIKSKCQRPLHSHLSCPLPKAFASSILILSRLALKKGKWILIDLLQPHSIAITEHLFGTLRLFYPHDHAMWLIQ